MVFTLVAAAENGTAGVAEAACRCWRLYLWSTPRGAEGKPISLSSTYPEEYKDQAGLVQKFYENTYDISKKLNFDI